MKVQAPGPAAHGEGESGQEHCQRLVCFAWGSTEAVELLNNHELVH